MAKEKKEKQPRPVKASNTAENKRRRIERQAKLAARLDGAVSTNCLKKRQERRRNNTPDKRRAARSKGERQFITPTAEGE